MFKTPYLNIAVDQACQDSEIERIPFYVYRDGPQGGVRVTYYVTLSTHILPDRMTYIGHAVGGTFSYTRDLVKQK